MAHRGPDSEGVWLSPHAALGHRRLAIIDIGGGQQPMAFTALGASCVLTFSGEIYNYRDLRNELKSLGHVFRTHSDTEVLLQAYVEWGQACVHRLDGMFAFGMWDEAKNELFLARDRLGVKPLFYSDFGAGLVFASEIKALLAHPSIPAQVGEDGLAELLALGEFRTPGHAVFRRVCELRSGHSLTFGREGTRVSRYWQVINKSHEDDEATTTFRIHSLLERAVSRQINADVPICAMLSGGLDSSIVGAIAAQAMQTTTGDSLSSYSIHLDREKEHFQPSDLQPDLDRPWAAQVAGVIGSKHREVLITSDSMIELATGPTRARDLPSLGSRDDCMYAFCRAIKHLHSVALSGEAADEILGGYPWFHNDAVKIRDAFPWHVSGDYGLARYLNPELASRLSVADYERARVTEALAEVPCLDDEDPHARRVREVVYLHLTRFLPALLERKDRMSMAVGLEVRVPFCDHHLVEYVWNIPWRMKTARQREKGLLRLAFSGLLPEDVLWRRKCAFPEPRDPAYIAAIRKLLLAELEDHDAPIRLLIDVTKLRADVLSARDCKQDWRLDRIIRGALQLNLWLRHYRVALR